MEQVGAFIILGAIIFVLMVGAYLGRHDHLDIDSYMALAEEEEVKRYSTTPPAKALKAHGRTYKHEYGSNMLEGKEVPVDTYRSADGHLITLSYEESRGGNKTFCDEIQDTRSH